MTALKVKIINENITIVDKILNSAYFISLVPNILVSSLTTTSSTLPVFAPALCLLPLYSPSPSHSPRTPPSMKSQVNVDPPGPPPEPVNTDIQTQNMSSPSPHTSPDVIPIHDSLGNDVDNTATPTVSDTTMGTPDVDNHRHEKAILCVSGATTVSSVSDAPGAPEAAVISSTGDAQVSTEGNASIAQQATTPHSIALPGNPLSLPTVGEVFPAAPNHPTPPSTPTVHFPDSLPIPIHENSHYNPHHHHHYHHHHHHTHHHQAHKAHTNTPNSHQGLANHSIEGDMGTPLPSYASSPHISRSSSRMSMRSLMISLATPSDVESLHTENHSYGFFDRPLHGSSHDNYHSFGYKLGHRLDTLAAGEHCEECSGTGNEGGCEQEKHPAPPRGEVLCIHPMRSGVPMKLPLPTLADHDGDEGDQRGRNRTVKSATSSLRYQVDTVITEEQEKQDAEAEDCTAKLLMMADKQLRRTYNRLKKLTDELEGYGPIAPTPSNEENLEKVSVVEPMGVTIVEPTSPTAISSVSASSPLQQLVIERAAADPQHLRHLAELNLRLLRNLQDSMRRMDKLALVMKEHNAGMIKADGDGDGDDGDDEVFVVQERDEVREKRRNSGSRESEDGTKEARKIPQILSEANQQETVEPRKGGIVCLFRYLLPSKSRFKI